MSWYYFDRSQWLIRGFVFNGWTCDRLRKTRLRWFGHVHDRNKNSILRRAMELEVEGRRPVGRPKKTWSKVMEEDMSKLNITEDMAENRQQQRQLISHPTPEVGN